jgi:hypothetical protein
MRMKIVVASVALMSTALAYAVNTYAPDTASSGVVTLDAVQVGDTTYNNVAITITLSSVKGVGGTIPLQSFVQGGLNWSPVKNATYNWTQANSYCQTSTFNGQTGWRLPTLAELSGLSGPIADGALATGGLYASGGFIGRGWALAYVWSSTPSFAGQDNIGGYNGVFLADNANPKFPFKAGQAASSAIADKGYVTCVK